MPRCIHAGAAYTVLERRKGLQVTKALTACGSPTDRFSDARASRPMRHRRRRLNSRRKHLPRCLRRTSRPNSHRPDRTTCRLNRHRNRRRDSRRTNFAPPGARPRCTRRHRCCMVVQTRNRGASAKPLMQPGNCGIQALGAKSAWSFRGAAPYRRRTCNVIGGRSDRGPRKRQTAG